MPEASTILCPHCGRPVEITQAVAAGLRKQVEAEALAGLEARTKALAAREAEAQKREAAAQAAQQQAEQRIQAEVGRRAQAIEADAKAAAQRASGAEIALLKQQAEEARKGREAAEAKELELRKQRETLEGRERTLELTLARRLDEERARLAEAAQRTAFEAYELKLRERDEREAGFKRKISEMQQRLEQGSMQTQGEVLETWLEDELRRAFPGDVIEPIGKGVRGADLVQRVRGAGGAEAGAILWESKRTKAWAGDWVPKLRDDQRARKAHVAALVSQVLPPGAPLLSCQEGVWVCTYAAALGVAALLRNGLLEVQAQQRTQDHRGDKEALIYAYLTGGEFRRRFEGFLEPLLQMERDLEREKSAFQRQWAARGKQIERAKTNLLGLRGDVEGLSGGLLPDVDAPLLPDPDDDGEA